MAQRDTMPLQGKLSGQAVINELIRNMELGQFEMDTASCCPVSSACIFIRTTTHGSKACST